MFQQHDTWWDLLCVLDLPNGAGYVYSPGEDTNRHALLSAMGGRASPTPSIQVHKSASKQSLTNIVGSRFQKLLSHLPLAGSAANAHVASDQKFVSDVVTGINAPLGEEWVRQQFYDYTSSILHLVNDLRSSSPIKAAGVNQSSTSRPPDGRRSIGSEVVPPHPPTSVSPKRSLPGCAPGIADGTNGLDAPAQPAAGSPGAADDSAARLNNEQGGALKLPQHRRFVSDTALNSRDSPSSAPAGASESIKSDTRAVAAVASSPQVAVGVKNSVLDSKKLSTTTAKFIEANRNRVRVLSTSSEVLSMPIHPWAWASMHIRRQSRLSFVQAEKKNEEELYGSSPMAAVARSASAFSVSSNGAASPEKGAEATDANDADAIAIPSGDGAVPLGGEAAGEAGAGASTAATEDTAEDLFPDLDSDRSPPEEHRKHVPPDATQEPDASPTPGLPQAAGAGVEAGAKAKVEAGTSAIDDVRNESRGLEQQIGRGKVGSLEHKLSAADQYDIPITVMNSVSVEDSTAPELQAVKVVSFDERAEQSGKLEDSSNSTLRRLFKDARSNSMSSSFFSDSEEDEDDNDDNDEDVNNFADGDEDAAFDENDDADYDEHDDVVEGAIASAIVQDTDKDTLGILLRKYLRKLQYEKGLIDSESEAPLYFQVLEQFLRSEFDIQALLVMFPESQGGLAVIARGLFHANPVVYYCAVCILQRVQSFDSTRAAFESLSSYYRSAFQCQQQKVESGVWKFEMKQFRRARRKTRIKMAKEQKTALNAAASMPLLTDTGSYGGYGATASSNAGATGGAAAGMGTTRSSFSSLGHEHAGGGNRGTASSTHPPPHSDSNVDLVGAAMGVAVGAAAAGWSVFNSALAAVNPRTSNTTPANSSMGGGVAAGGKATAAAITSNKTQSAETGEAKSSGEKDAAAAADMEGNAPLGTFIQTTLNMIAAAAEPPPNAEENQFDSLELLR